MTWIFGQGQKKCKSVLEIWELIKQDGKIPQINFTHVKICLRLVLLMEKESEGLNEGLWMKELIQSFKKKLVEIQ